jgi:hypothetical protein
MPKKITDKKSGDKKSADKKTGNKKSEDTYDTGSKVSFSLESLS